MKSINVHIPLKLRIRGEFSGDNWSDLEKALFNQYTRAIERSLVELAKSRFSEQGIATAGHGTVHGENTI